MGATHDRLAVFPTRMVLGQLQTRMQGAEKGKTLLERKADALKAKHKEVASVLLEKKQQAHALLENARFLMTKAEFYGGDLKMAIHQANKHSLQVQASMETVAGIFFPTLFLEKKKKEMYFMGAGGKMLSECRNSFLQALEHLVELSSTQMAFSLIDALLMVTNRRVNALSYVLIPRLENTIAYVQSELDEQDREEFFRLKKLQKK
ncbi:V-type H+-transporting ATPase subunit D [Nematocida sp. LUAm3]|nr:V-type H+-transporting ATPase subunit D [Nematocida sp. LUAm3]KAI5171858.1 V-type H+-transporting ATPase subunit D [Nematocida sp. LUAm3]KAI5173266.1 V-type H+-transporting ATPase subunit D [Nematocida sp. LUAm3]KAI5176433.1 V-type H+-transporting ATPase subunit D [Nematocida sp. LUAm2]KAI5179284.1 V-type H+-transporting ATPase subunit D [Nematocida sp. LUAm1]